MYWGPMGQGREPGLSGRIIHFVGFRDDRYWNAVRIWGRPTYIHRGWDRRAQIDIAPGDLVIFATGTEADPPKDFNYPDLDEPTP